MTVLTSYQKKEPDSETCWALLERVAASSQLRQAARMRELLIFVGQRSLKDGQDQVHEQEIGCAVFGRPDGYDTALDNIVRTNVSYLRKRIDAYFETEGQHEKLLMEIPRGSYVPVFHYRRLEPGIVPQFPLAAIAPGTEPPDAVPVTPQGSKDRRWMLSGLIVSGIIILALAFGCLSLWIQNRNLYRSFYAWKYSPSVAGLWTEFLDASPNTDIVMSDAFFKLAQDVTKQSFTLDDYLNRRYIHQLIAQEKSPDALLILGKVSAWSSGNSNHLTLARRILALDPPGKSIRLYYARDYTPDLIKQDNVVLLGSRVTNPWDTLFDGRLNFTVKLDNDDISAITNRSPAAGEQSIYTRTESVGYCVVAYLPNPNGKSKVLLTEGTSVEATEAGGNFLLSEDQLSGFQKMIHANKLPYFEVLLKTSQVKGTPFTSTIQAYRTYPGSN